MCSCDWSSDVCSSDLGSEGNVRDCVEWNNLERRQKRRNLKRRTRGSTSIRLLPLLVYLFLFCRQFISEDPAHALPSSLLRPSSRSSTSYIDADVSTLTKTLLDLSLSLFVRYQALFTLRNISALRPRSTRSLQPCSRRIKSVHSSLT